MKKEFKKNRKKTINLIKKDLKKIKKRMKKERNKINN